ncbi:MAG: anti-sigma factor [Candidatus Omnitrophica bacterium]|nr:anti-sigma factor [Candidatus Omnitrophota bacterium]
MKCKKIRDIILSDYTDGELSSDRQKLIEDHLKGCPACREFLEELTGGIVTPLRESGHVKPPAEVWNRIERAIGEKEKSGAGETLLDWIKARAELPVLRRKPAFVLATILVAFLLAGGITARYFSERRGVNTYIEEQFDFLDSLANGNGDSYEDNGFSLDYFLL